MSAELRHSSAAHRLAALLLAACLVAALSALAPATADAALDTRRPAIPVGDLKYSDGAGSKTWGLRQHAAWSTRVLKHRYSVGTVGGYRPSSTSDHGDRLAADLMVYSNTKKGHRIARFAKRHHKQLNVTYICWNQRIWSVERASEGWRAMSDMGSATANHRDHVHARFRRSPKNYTYRD
jgi:hypothetical protein